MHLSKAEWRNLEGIVLSNFSKTQAGTKYAPGAVSTSVRDAGPKLEQYAYVFIKKLRLLWGKRGGVQIDEQTEKIPYLPPV